MQHLATSFNSRTITSERLAPILNYTLGGANLTKEKRQVAPMSDNQRKGAEF